MVADAGAALQPGTGRQPTRRPLCAWLVFLTVRARIGAAPPLERTAAGHGVERALHCETGARPA
jgi:hypothetical protein